MENVVVKPEKVKPKYNREELKNLELQTVTVTKAFENNNVDNYQSDTTTILGVAFDPENIDMITELSSSQIKHMARGDVLLNKFKIPALETLMESIKIKSISKDRQSRKEMIEFNKRNDVSDFDMGDKDNTLINRLTGA